MRVSMQTADQNLGQLRDEIQQLTAAFERENGAVQTTDIIQRGLNKAVWNGKLVSDKVIKQTAINCPINQKVSQRYATEPCLKALAKELDITVNSLTKRAGRLGVGRDEAAKIDNHAGNQRSTNRLTKTAELLEAGQPVETIAEKLNISPRQVRQYRQQLEIMQEAA